MDHDVEHDGKGNVNSTLLVAEDLMQSFKGDLAENGVHHHQEPNNFRHLVSSRSSDEKGRGLTDRNGNSKKVVFPQY